MNFDKNTNYTHYILYTFYYNVFCPKNITDYYCNFINQMLTCVYFYKHDVCFVTSCVTDVDIDDFYQSLSIADIYCFIRFNHDLRVSVINNDSNYFVSQFYQK